MPKKTSEKKSVTKKASANIKIKQRKKAKPVPETHVIDLKKHALVEVKEEPIIKKKPELEENYEDEEEIEEDLEVEETEFAVRPRRARLTEEGENKTSYKKVIGIFLTLSGLCLLAAAYVAFIRLDIVIKSEPRLLETESLFTIYDRPDNYNLPSDGILGLVREMEIDFSREFTTTGQTEGKAEVSGRVTIINNYSQSQPLVATTRLLSSNNQLLRLRNTVSVPAGGSIEVDVYSDEVDPRFFLPAGRLTIPGLWAGLQEQIYAEVGSDQVTYRSETISVVSEQDLNNAIAAVRDEIIKEARRSIEEKYADYDEKLYEIDESSITYETKAKAGDQVETFTMQLSGLVKVAAFDSENIRGELESLVYASTEEGGKVTAKPKINFTIIQADTVDNIADVKASIVADATFSPAMEIIDRSSLVNLRKDQVEAYLNRQPWITSYELNFQPTFWKISPALADRIKIYQE